MTTTVPFFVFVVSVLGNVVGILFAHWDLRRTRSLAADFVKLRDEKIASNQKFAATNQVLIHTNTQLLTTQTQLHVALRQVENYKREADFWKQLRDVAVRVAENKIAAAQRRRARHEADEAEVQTLVIHVPGLDEQTKNLVRLAVDNPSPNEGAAAALIVCKRLKEQI